MSLNVLACPDCGAEIILGEEICESCFSPLTPLDMNRRVKSFMMKDRVSSLKLGATQEVPPTTSLHEAIGKMPGRLDACVWIVDGGRLVGVITERDILYKVAGADFDIQTTPVEKIMTRDPVRVQTRDRVAVVFNRMAVGGFRHVPVFDEDKLVGQLTMSDMLEYLLAHRPS